MMIWRWVLVILIVLIIGLFLLAYFGDRAIADDVKSKSI